MYLFLAFIKQDSFNKFPAGIETGKKVAFFRSLEVDVDKMIKFFGESINNKCFSNLPGSPQHNRFPVCGGFPTQ